MGQELTLRAVQTELDADIAEQRRRFVLSRLASLEQRQTEDQLAVARDLRVIRLCAKATGMQVAQRIEQLLAR
jgi:hypothetical protein